MICTVSGQQPSKIMPLKCLGDGREIYAFDVESEEAWASLRLQNSTSRHLRMPCCGAGVVLRESKLGTRHFAHARRGDCATAPETAEHLLAKHLVVAGIRRTSWAAHTERTGQTPAGDEWRADVLAEKGKAKVAFEIQWSAQPDDETVRRQERYAAAGVRGLWLFRQRKFPTTKQIPAFRLAFKPEEQAFQVLLPSPLYSPEWMTSKELDAPRVWQQAVELEDFVQGALSGRLRFAPTLGAKMPFEVHAAEGVCWRCKKPTNIVTGLVFAAGRVFPGHPSIDTSIYELADAPGGVEGLQALFPVQRLKSLGVGAIKPRHSKTEGRAYMSNGCVHCDAIQGRFFEHEVAYASEKLLEVDAELKPEWASAMPDSKADIYCWWFDTRAELG